MEIKEDRLFTISTSANGQGFSFGITAVTQVAAYQDLLLKLQIISKELEKEIASRKSTAN